MGALGYMIFPSLAKERDRLSTELYKFQQDHGVYATKHFELLQNYEALADQLASMTLRAVSAEAKLNGMHKPAPLEPTTIKVGTAADVRRIVEHQNFRDEQENSDGIR